MLVTLARSARVQPSRLVRGPPPRGNGAAHPGMMGQALRALWSDDCSPPGVQPSKRWALGACPIMPEWAAPHQLGWLGPGWTPMWLRYEMAIGELCMNDDHVKNDFRVWDINL